MGDKCSKVQLLNRWWVACFIKTSKCFSEWMDGITWLFCQPCFRNPVLMLLLSTLHGSYFHFNSSDICVVISLSGFNWLFFLSLMMLNIDSHAFLPSVHPVLSNVCSCCIFWGFFIIVTVVFWEFFTYSLDYTPFSDSCFCPIFRLLPGSFTEPIFLIYTAQLP
jgi:hypothetical protein